jgi:hypothetical protein
MRHPIAIIALKGDVEADEDDADDGLAGAGVVGEEVALSIRVRRFVVLANIDGAAFDDWVLPASISLQRQSAIPPRALWRKKLTFEPRKVARNFLVRS